MKYSYKIVRLFNGQYGIVRSDEQPYCYSFFTRAEALKTKKLLEATA